MIDDKIDKYLNERKPTPYDKEIKDAAIALTGEIESFIENIVKDWWDNNEWNFSDGSQMDKNDIMKAINLAVKKINIKKLEI